MKSIINLPALAAVLATSAFFSGAQAAEKDADKAKKAGGDAASQLSAADQKFVKTAAIDGMTEVALGEMAAEKAAKPEVKEFGTMMVTDHGKANTELMALATAKGMTLPGKLDKEHQAKVDKMAKLEGEAFDKAYVTEMVAAHKKAVSLFENASKSLKDEELKGFAEKTLPVLKTHLEHAQGHGKHGGAAKKDA